MPQALQVTFEPTLGDFVGVAWTAPYKVVESTLGYGLLVVTEAKKDELVATGQWTDVTPS